MSTRTVQIFSAQTSNASSAVFDLVGDHEVIVSGTFGGATAKLVNVLSSGSNGADITALTFTAAEGGKIATCSGNMRDVLSSASSATSVSIEMRPVIYSNVR